MSKTAVIALGGNAITRKEVEDTITNQFANTRSSLYGLIELIRGGYNIAVTHGNGPQVGNAILRVELARGKAPILPLGICVADTEGGMGYMIGQSLQNRLYRDKIQREVVTIITQVEVNQVRSGACQSQQIYRPVLHRSRKRFCFRPSATGS